MRAMLIFAFIPLVVLFAQPLGTYSPWFPVILIGIGCAAHGASILVSEYLYDCERYVSEECNCHSDGNWWYGRRS